MFDIKNRYVDPYSGFLYSIDRELANISEIMQNINSELSGIHNLLERIAPSLELNSAANND